MSFTHSTKAGVRKHLPLFIVIFFLFLSQCSGLFSGLIDSFLAAWPEDKTWFKNTPQLGYVYDDKNTMAVNSLQETNKHYEPNFWWARNTSREIIMIFSLGIFIYNSWKTKPSSTGWNISHHFVHSSRKQMFRCAGVQDLHCCILCFKMLHTLSTLVGSASGQSNTCIVFFLSHAFSNVCKM